MRLRCVDHDKRGDLTIGAEYKVWETYWDGNVVTVSRFGRWLRAEWFKPVVRVKAGSCDTHGYTP